MNFLAVPALAAIIATNAFAQTAAPAEPAYLLPNDKAPELKVAKFYQGNEIKKFESGKVYVVEFWATWCGPCIETIPHLNELSQKHKGKVDFVGVNIWDDEAGQDERISKFIKDMGAKMSYPVAVDTPEMWMTSKWMEASVSNGIPTAFIVNQEGKIAWIGHPSEIDEPLQQVVDKKFDIAAARTAREASIKEEIEMNRLFEQLGAARELYTQGKKAEAIAMLDELAKNEKIGSDAKITKISLYATDDVPAAKKAIDDLAKGEFGDIANLSFFSIEQATGEKGNRELAVYAGDQILKNIKKDEPIVLYYISPAYSVTNDHKKALEVLERALKAFDTSEYAKEESMKDFRVEIENAIKKEKAAIAG